MNSFSLVPQYSQCLLFVWSFHLSDSLLLGLLCCSPLQNLYASFLLLYDSKNGFKLFLNIFLFHLSNTKYQGCLVLNSFSLLENLGQMFVRGMVMLLGQYLRGHVHHTFPLPSFLHKRGRYTDS